MYWWSLNLCKYVIWVPKLSKYISRSQNLLNCVNPSETTMTPLGSYMACHTDDDVAAWQILHQLTSEAKSKNFFFNLLFSRYFFSIFSFSSFLLFFLCSSHCSNHSHAVWSSTWAVSWMTWTAAWQLRRRRRCSMWATTLVRWWR